MPVYWFALSQVPHINWTRAILVFIILHLLVYPASNGYNSYMDRDTGSIGGLKNPMQPTKQLFIVTMILDVLALDLSLLIGWLFTLTIFLYILASKAYSYRAIRLKKYPILGYLTAVIFQGAVTFFLVYHGSDAGRNIDAPLAAMLGASLLIGGFYPLTQIYQHEDDKKDGVRTISYALGYKGTFIFTGIVYALAMGVLVMYFNSLHLIENFFIFLGFMLPVLIYFIMWMIKVWGNYKEANFVNTMRMIIIGSSCTNLAFITLLIMHLNE
jgi:1,4-dihydroxy-2-naphthoate polyprenyltransferase